MTAGAEEAARLLQRLRELEGELSARLRERYDRDLPLEELVVDRWERASRLGFGEGASLHASSYVYGDVRVGAGTWVGPMVLLDGTGGLSIGSHCSVSAGVQIYTHDTVRWALSGGEADAERSAVAIGDRCHIGAGATILRGVEIGDGCVVGANSLVNNDLPAGSVAYGCPARVRGSVEITRSGEIEIRHDAS